MIANYYITKPRPNYLIMNKKEHKILKICFEKLKYLNYSKNTIKIYMYYIEEFLNSTNKNYQHLNSSDFEDYLKDYNFTSISKQNQVISSIKFLYKRVLKKKYNKVDFKRPRKNKKLPKVIDKDFLLKNILEIKTPKHKAILSLGYSCGLRVSEVINLKIEDIDSKRMIINIRNSKGNKDRIVPLSMNLLGILRSYYKKHKPKEYLFNGQYTNRYSSTSCNKIVKKYLGNKYHFHLLRHSCFTHLL